MNCQDALSLLYEIIDKEASEIDVKEVQQHLDRCRHCFEIYRLESAVQEFISQKLKDRDSSCCLESLKAKIMVRLDQIDQESISAERRSFFRRAAAVLVAAAAIVTLVWVAFWGRDLYCHQTEYVPLERAHWAASERLSSIRDEARTASVLTEVREQLGYEVSPAIAGFSLVGGQTEEIMGLKMAHLVYVHDSEIVSVFVVPAERFRIPDDLKESMVRKDQLTLYDHHCRSCRLVYHQIGRAVVITATTDHTIDLLSFIPGQTAI
jgi:anti-sigma factor (TIGR02949 family)